jgi:hypothetical protein
MKRDLATAMKLTLFIVAGVFSAACDDLATNQTERDALTKVRTGEYRLVKTSDFEIVPKSELAELKRAAETGRSVGRYQQYSRGVRTWRFDTASGQTCLLLTTQDDWKKEETKNEACQ